MIIKGNRFVHFGKTADIYLSDKNTLLAGPDFTFGFARIADGISFVLPRNTNG
jgi:hypothetical protein